MPEIDVFVANKHFAYSRDDGTSEDIVVSEPHEEMGQYEVTAYTLRAKETGKTRSHPTYGITASGERAQDGITAACPPEMPFGTVIAIEGVGERICQDRGGAIKGRRIDVYIPDLQEALEFGRQTLSVTILSEGAD